MYIPNLPNHRDDNSTLKKNRFRSPPRKHRRSVDIMRPATDPAVCRVERLESRRLLSTVTWINAVGGSWSTPANWSTGAVPQNGDSVIINHSGNIQITLTAAVSISSLSITGDTLVVQSGGSLTTTAGLANSGTITVNAGCQITVGGNYSQTSAATLSLPGGGSTSDPASNLLANSGFESPVITTSTTTSPGGWSAWGTSYLNKNYAYAGSQSLVTSGPNSGALQTFGVTPGASYTLSVDAMTPAGNALTGSEGGYILLMFYDSGGNQISSYSPPNSVTVLTASSAAGGPLAGSVGSQGWNHYSTTAVAPTNAATVNAIVEVGAYNGSGLGGGAVYWDAPQFGPAVGGPSKLSAGSISNSGAIIVGPTNTLVASGAFTQTSTATLDVQIGGAPSSGNIGFVQSMGIATLAGTLKSDLVYGYVPSTTDIFTPLEFASESGGFASYQLPSGSGYQFQGAATFTNVVLSVIPTSPLTVSVNAGTVVHTVNANLLGVNLAYWDSALNTAQTQQLAQSAGLNEYRFPGGSASDGYHFNLSSNYGDSSANTVSQFASFIQSVAGTGVLTMDYGSGSPQEAAAELAYLQGATSDATSLGTGIEWNDAGGAWQTINWKTVGYWASLRVASPLGTNDGLNFLRISHSAPFTNIKYWEVGNEEYGSWEVDHHGTAGPGGVSTGAQHDPATYATFAKQFAGYAVEITTAAGWPAVSIGIDSGDPTGAPDGNWTKNVLTAGASIGFVPGFISDHSYMQGPGNENDAFLLNSTVSNAASVFDWTTRYADYQTLLQQTVPAQASGVQLMATEFNSVYTDPGKQSTSLVNGLFIADSLGSLLNSGYSGGSVWDLRNSRDTSKNNSPALYGWRNGGDYGILGDPNISQPPSTGPYLAYPSYYAEQLASKIIQTGGQAVLTSSNYQEFHAYSVMEPNGNLQLLVINTDPAGSLTEQFNLQGFQPGGQAQVWQYGESQDTAQSQSSTGASALSNFSVTLGLSGSNFSYSLPAYSMAVIDLAPNVVSGSVFNDANNSGTKEAGETGLAAVKVTLTPTGSTGGSAVSILSAADGSYSFANVPLGSYTIRETLPTGYALTAPLGGNAAVTVAAGVSTAGPVFGDVLISSVILNFNMLVALSQDYNKPGTFANGDLNGDGMVNFNDLVLLSQNYNQTLPSGNYSSSIKPVKKAPASPPKKISAAVRSPRLLEKMSATPVSALPWASSFII